MTSPAGATASPVLAGSSAVPGWLPGLREDGPDDWWDAHAGATVGSIWADHEGPPDPWASRVVRPDALPVPAAASPSGSASEAWPSEELLGWIADGQLGPGAAPLDVVDAVAVLTAADPGTLGGAARVDLVRGLERVLGMLAGVQQRAIAAVADATVDLGLAEADARHEIGAALRLAPATAGDRTAVAVALRDQFPATLAALCRGQVSWRQAANLVDGVTGLPPETAAAVEARVLDRMGAQTAAETRRAVRDAVVRADPAAAEQRLRAGHRDRRVERVDQSDGTRAWWFPMTPDVEHDMWTALTRRAKALPDTDQHDPGLRSLDARRVDAIVDAILRPDAAPASTEAAVKAEPDGAAGTAAERVDDITVGAAPRAEPLADRVTAPGPCHPGSAGGCACRGEPGPGQPGYLPRCSCGGKQVAAVVLDLDTALGLADNPGVIPGYGTVPGRLARAMAADRDWVRWTTDPGTRHLLDRGAHTYRPSEKMKAYIAARDRTCGFPGCHRPAQDCDCDHVINHTLPNGKTITINLGPLCRQHHNAKTHGRWHLTYDPLTQLKTWTSPLGKTYTRGTDPPLL